MRKKIFYTEMQAKYPVLEKSGPPPLTKRGMACGYRFRQDKTCGDLYLTFFTAFFLIFSNRVFAGEMSWQEILSEAGKNNPALKKAEANRIEKEISYKLSKANLLPGVSGSLGTSLSGNDKSVPNSSYSMGLSGRVSLFSGYSDLTNIKSKGLDIKIEEERRRRTLSEVYSNLKKSFINLLWIQELVKMNNKIFDRRIKNFELIKLKYDAGREDKGSLLRVEADKYQAEYEIKQSGRSIEEYSALLSKNIGYENSSLITATSNLAVEELPPAPDFNKLVLETPEYLIAGYNLEKAGLNIISARSDYYPALSFSAGLSHSGNYSGTNNSGWNTGLSLSYSFYSGNKTNYNLQLAEINKSLQEKTLFETKLQLGTSLKTAWNNLESAVENLKIREKYLNATEEESKIISVKYLNGLATYYDWYNVENDYINSQKSYLSSKKEALLAKINWENLTGKGE